MPRIAAVTAAAWSLALSAAAASYETSQPLEGEDDILALEQGGELAPDAAEALLELLREGVDLNEGSRDELYELPSLTYADVDRLLAFRAAHGRIEDPSVLVASEVLTERQLLEIAPFIRIGAAPVAPRIGGRLRALTAFSHTDGIGPPALLAIKLGGAFGLRGSLLVSSTRRLVAPPRYEPLLDTLVSAGPRWAPTLPRAALEGSWRSARVLVGTFAIGFAERLTLDTTRQRHPHGFAPLEDYRRPLDLARACQLSSDEPLPGLCLDDGTTRYVTPDFALREPFRGVAASLRELPLGPEARLSAFAFASYQTRSIYQYELFDRRGCADPRDDDDGACAAPSVYLADASAPGATRIVFSTLPGLYDELAGGARVEVAPRAPWRIGVTGYGARPIFRGAPMRLDFQEHSRMPWGGPFGAIGADARWERGAFQLALEAARTVDGAEGGGFGIVQRTTWSAPRQELELHLRYFDRGFANPYARPQSAPDEYDGLRARNELGARLRGLSFVGRDFDVAGSLDVWTLPFDGGATGRAGTVSAFARLRGAYRGLASVEPSLWLDARNRNLASNVRGGCTPAESSLGEASATTDEAPTCAGDTYRVGAGATLRPFGPRHALALQGTFTWTDDPRLGERFRNDAALRAELRTTLHDAVRARAGARWRFEDVWDNGAGEQWLLGLAEVQLRLPRSVAVTARAEVRGWLDRRESTAARRPNPELRWLVDAEWRF